MNDKLKHKIIKYLISEYRDLDTLECEKYSGYIFFMKDGKLIFDYNKKNGYVAISYDKIWSFLESFFGLKYEEIQDLTKEWVEEHFKLGVTTTLYPNQKMRQKVEEHFKLGVTTTWKGNGSKCNWVEEHFKLGVTKTWGRNPRQLVLVEEHFKLKTNER